MSALEASKILLGVAKSYLTYTLDEKKKKSKLESIPIVQDYLEVFPEELTGSPLKQEVEFVIEVEANNALISKAPYRMAPTELKKPMVQLQELLDNNLVYLLEGLQCFL